MIEDYNQFLYHYHLAKDVPYNPIWEDMFGSPTGAITDPDITELSRCSDKLNRRILIIPKDGDNIVYVQTFAGEQNIVRVEL